MRYQRDEADEAAYAVDQLMEETVGIDFTVRDIDTNIRMGEAEGEPADIAPEALGVAFCES